VTEKPLDCSKRYSTDYPGVFYREAKRKGGSGLEKVYYCRFKRGGKVIECKIGRQYADNMTPAKANRRRTEMVEGREDTPQVKREKARQKKWDFAALWKRYAEDKAGNKSIHDDKLRYDKYLKKTIGSREPHELRQIDFERIKRVHLKHLSPQSQKHVLALIVRLARYGARKELCQGLVTIPEMPKVNNEKTEDLSPMELKRLLKVLEEWPDQNTAGIFKMALVTGMRRGELFRLKWEHIDFRRKTVKIIEPKRGEDAVIPLSDAAKSVLEGLPENPSEYVFPGATGGQRSCVNRASREIREKAKLPKGFRMLHGLRHFFASELASSGKVEMYVLQKLLTHKSPKMTQRYAHLRDHTLQDAAAVANGILDQGLRTVK
jgi:integrase